MKTTQMYFTGNPKKVHERLAEVARLSKSYYTWLKDINFIEHFFVIALNNSQLFCIYQ